MFAGRENKMLVLSVKGIDREYGLGRSIIRPAIDSGELPASRVKGRFLVFREDLEAWIRSRRVKPEVL